MQFKPELSENININEIKLRKIANRDKIGPNCKIEIKSMFYNIGKSLVVKIKKIKSGRSREEVPRIDIKSVSP